MEDINKKVSLKDKCCSEDGVVLIVTVALLAVLTLVGTIVVNTTNMDIKISNNYKTSKQAFYAAEAGTELARARLRGATTTANHIVDTAVPPSETWSTYISTSDSWQPTNDPDHDPAYSNTLLPPISQTDLSFWAKVRHKRESDATTGSYIDQTAGNNEMIYYGFTDPSIQGSPVQFSTSSATIYHPVEIITAYGSSSSSLKGVEIEVVHNPGPPIITTLYGKSEITINGSSAKIYGTDNCGAAPALPPVYAYNADVDDNPLPDYQGNPDAAVEDGDIDIVIEDYVDSLKTDADVTIVPSPGNDAESFITGTTQTYYFDSSAASPSERTLSNITGYGILLIEGNLTLAGGFNWNGLILVTGELTFNGGGGGINIRGAAYGNSTVDLNGGLDIRYDSCMIDNAFNNRSLDIVKWGQKY